MDTAGTEDDDQAQAQASTASREGLRAQAPLARQERRQGPRRAPVQAAARKNNGRGRRQRGIHHRRRVQTGVDRNKRKLGTL